MLVWLQQWRPEFANTAIAVLVFVAASLGLYFVKLIAGQGANTRASDGDEGLLVNAVGAIFQTLKWLTPLGFLRATVLRRWNHAAFSTLVDLWVCFHLAGAAALAALSANAPSWPAPWREFALAYGLWRLFDVLVTQVNVLLFDPYFVQRDYRAGKRDTPFALRGRHRLVIAILFNLAEVALWYTAAYVYFGAIGQLAIDGYENGAALSVVEVFRLCLQGLLSIDASAFHPGAGSLSSALVYSQPFVGGFLTLVTLARVISILPTPAADSDPPRHHGG